jgi:hypothetical protein
MSIKSLVFLKIVGGQAVLATVTGTVVNKMVVDKGKQMAVNAAGRLITSTGARIGASTIGAAVLTAILTVIPLQTSDHENSKSWIDQKQAAMEKAKAFYAQAHIEEFRDPSTLSDEYLKGVQDRILQGTASGQDHLYQSEYLRRQRGGVGGSDGGAKPLAKIVDIDRDVMIFSAKIDDEAIAGTSHFSVKDNILSLDGLHIQGSKAGKVGRANMWKVAKDIGRQFGATEVHIQGGVRTSGKYKGQKPSPLVIKVD